MDRRAFLTLFGAGIAGIALEQAIPLGRVWSFPKQIVIPKWTTVSLDQPFGIDYGWEDLFRPMPIGTIIRVRMPQRFIIAEEFKDCATGMCCKLKLDQT